MAEGREVGIEAARGVAWAAIARSWPVVIAVMLGVGLIYGAGFAGSSALHEAAHDSRHSFAFPCH